MLSPGQWFKEVPKDRLQNLKFRQFVLQKAHNNPRVQKALIECCRQDILFFINIFVFQYNPNSIGDASAELGPFITWDFQDRAILKQRGIPWNEEDDSPEQVGILWAIDNREDLLIEKSREMGASWLCLLVILWLFLFHPWKKVLMISRSEEAVDKPDDADSLFWKLDFVLSYLPHWMAKPDATYRRRKRVFRNLVNNSSITGQASTGEAGVGGRAKIMFIDEFSAIKEDFEVRQRTSDTTGCRIFNGTHRGTETCFYALSRTPEIKKLYLHWTQHPDKVRGLYRFNELTQQVDILDKDYLYPADCNFVMSGLPLGGLFPGLRSPWYDDQCVRKGNARAVAMDLDINAEGSVSQAMDVVLINTLIGSPYCRRPDWTGRLAHDQDTGRDPFLMAQPDGRLHLWLNLDKDGAVAYSDYVIGGDIARGRGATPSCLSIVDGRTGHKVGAYVDANIKPEALAILAVALCSFFKNEQGEPARLIWEMQGPGEDFGDKVIELGFRNVYYRVSTPHDLKKAISTKPGWYPSDALRTQVVLDYFSALGMRLFINPCQDALKETLKFIDDGRGFVKHANVKSVATKRKIVDLDPSGAGVSHGDRVIADALAWLEAKPLKKVQKKKEEAATPVYSLAWRRLQRHNLVTDREAWR